MSRGGAGGISSGGNSAIVLALGCAHAAVVIGSAQAAHTSPM
jgi:hypothetical protein